MSTPLWVQIEDNQRKFTAKEFIELCLLNRMLEHFEGIEKALWKICEMIDDIRKHGIEQLHKPQGA